VKPTLAEAFPAVTVPITGAPGTVTAPLPEDELLEDAALLEDELVEPEPSVEPLLPPPQPATTSNAATPTSTALRYARQTFFMNQPPKDHRPKS